MDPVQDANIYAAGREGESIADNINGNDITPEELALLDEAGEDMDEDELRNARLDNTDEDGELLNEKSSGDDYSGSDLDVPGSGDDDDNEDIGEEDEENNSYSASDNKD
ncbi:MAG: hypothetical protein HY305_02965 [Sphingobacteriales bacterium]|nr:hypothetical protein [Sphingobacteriales bacterium]